VELGDLRGFLAEQVMASGGLGRPGRMAFRLFVSYSNVDRARIEPLFYWIRNMPEKSSGLLDVFYFEDSKTPSANTTEEIVGAIHSSDAILYFHSANSAYGQYVQNEVGGAVVTGKQVIIAKLDATPVEGMLKGVNYLDFNNPDVFDREIIALTSMIRSKIEEKKAKENEITRYVCQQADVANADVCIIDSAGSDPNSESPDGVTVVQPYTAEDWKMVLAIVAVIVLLFVVMRASKSAVSPT
jgi:hypothetical protein